MGRIISLGSMRSMRRWGLCRLLPDLTVGRARKVCGGMGGANDMVARERSEGRVSVRGRRGGLTRYGARPLAGLLRSDTPRASAAPSLRRGHPSPAVLDTRPSALSLVT